jgi:hypothetical protein
MIIIDKLRKGEVIFALPLGYFLLIQIPTRAIANIMATVAYTIVIVLSIGCGYSGGAVAAGASETTAWVSPYEPP